MKINGICITYLDDYKKENWPKEFVEVPRLGLLNCVNISNKE